MEFREKNSQEQNFSQIFKLFFSTKIYENGILKWYLGHQNQLNQTILLTMYSSVAYFASSRRFLSFNTLEQRLQAGVKSSTTESHVFHNAW